ncbi:MAG: hypothetical protein GY755_05250 [Chloroflexi bacterium]|nr:hypothetical protein [Chloroflexota bacterium]
MNYGNILSSAWKTFWKHKVIIWFGMIMAIPTALMGILMGLIFYFFSEEKFFSYLEGTSPESDAFLLFIGLFFVGIILLSILSYATMALSFAGTLKGTFDLKDKETTISFHELWNASLPYVWRIFGIMAIIFIGILGFFAIIMFLGAIFGAVTAGIGFICLMPLMLLILPLELLAFLFASIAMVAVVVEDIGVFDAMRKAKDVLKENFWPWILMGIIVGFILWAVNMVAMLPMQVAQFAFMMPMMADPYMQDPTAFFRPLSILIAIMMPLMGIAQGLSLAYGNAIWVFSYLDITAETENNEDEIEYA